MAELLNKTNQDNTKEIRLAQADIKVAQAQKPKVESKEDNKKDEKEKSNKEEHKEEVASQKEGDSEKSKEKSSSDASDIKAGENSVKEVKNTLNKVSQSSDDASPSSGEDHTHASSNSISLTPVEFAEGGHESTIHQFEIDRTLAYDPFNIKKSHITDSFAQVSGAGDLIREEKITTMPSSVSRISFLDDANRDGVINKGEFNSLGAGVKLTLSATAQAGDTVSIDIVSTPNGGTPTTITREITLTPADITTGHIVTTVMITNNGNVEISAKTRRGELSSPVVNSSVDTDTTDPVAPTIDQIDGRSPTDPTNNERPVIKVTSPEGRPALVDEHGVDIPATIVDKGNGHYEITPNDSIKNKDVKVIATDDAGNKSTTTDLNAIIDTTAPSAPGSVRFVEDTNNDGRLNLVENDADSDQDHTKVEINLPTDALAGDKVNVKVENNGNTTTREITLSATDIANGKVSVTVPVVDVATTKVTASVTDRAGNKGAEVESSIDASLTGPTAPTINTIDGNTPGHPTKNTRPEIKVTSPEGTPKLVTEAGVDIPATVVDNGGGNYTITPTVPLINGQKIGVVATDNDGNQSRKTLANSGVDTIAPGAPTHLDMVEDTNNDGFININENSKDGDASKSKVKVGLPTGVVAGDKITVTLQDPNSGVTQHTKIVTADDVTNGYSLVEVPVATSGIYGITAKITDIAGNVGTSTGSNFKADLTPVAAPTILSIDNKAIGTPINNDKPVIKVTSIGGKPSLVDNDGNPIPATVNQVGTDDYEITPINPVNIGNINVVTTSEGKNVSPKTAVNINLDKTAPSTATEVKFLEDTNSDGKLNKAENDADGDASKTKIEIKLPSDLVAGDKVNVKIETNGVTTNVQRVITQTEINNGKAEVEVPVVDGKTTKITTTFTDIAGNESQAVVKTIDSDFTPPTAPVIVTIGGKTPGTAINNSKPEIKVTSPDGVPSLVDSHGNPIEATITDNGSGSYTITPKNPLSDNSSINVIATDGAGNKSTITTINSNIDTVAPSAPGAIKFLEDANNDGVLNKAENESDGNNATTKVEITLPSDAKTGDKVNVETTVNGVATTQEITLTNTNITDGKVTANVPVSNGHTTLVKASVTDAAGNKGQTIQSSLDAHTVFSHEGGTTTEINFSEDTNKDNKLNIAENKSDNDITKTGVEIKIPSGSAVAGDKLKIEIDHNGNITNREITLSSTDIANGKVTIDAPVSDATTTKATIKVVDQYGNESSAVTKTLTSKLSLPNAPTNIKFMEDTNNDNKLNKVENNADGDAAKTKVEIGIPTDAQVGDTLEVKANGVTVKKVTLNATDIATRKTVVEISVEQGNTTIKATVTDSSGNTSAETDKSIDVDTVAPTAPTITSVDGKSPTAPTNNNRPDIVVNSPDGTPKLVDDMGVEIPSTITDNGNGNYTIKPNSALPDDSNINVVTIDDAGNKSETTTVRSGIDTVAPNAPTIKFTEDINNNGEINLNESKADGNVTKTKVEIKLPNNVSLTDKLLVSVNGTEREITLTAAQISSKKVTLDVDIANETAMNIKAKIVDSAGNESGEIQKSATPYIVKPDAPTNIEFPNAINNMHDSWQTHNDNLDIKISLPTTAKAGDRVLLYQGTESSDHPGTLNNMGLRATITLTQADIANGYVTQRYRLHTDMHGYREDYRTFKFYAKIRDSHGNESDDSNSAITHSDHRLVVASNYTFTEDVNKDGTISKAENNSDGSLNKTSVEITFDKSNTPNGNIINVGDKITLTPVINGTPDATKKTAITVTQEIYDAGKVTLNNLTIHEGMVNSQNKITWKLKYETKGGRELGHHEGDITSAIEPDISAPTFTFTENTNNDAYINKVENQGDGHATTPIKINVDNTYNVGDKIEVKVNGTKTHTITVTSAMKSAGYTTADLTLSDSVKSTIEVSHSRGGVSQLTTKEITLDETISGANVSAVGLIGSSNTNTKTSINNELQANGVYVSGSEYGTVTKMTMPSDFNSDGHLNNKTDLEIAQALRDYFNNRGEEIVIRTLQTDMLGDKVHERESSWLASYHFSIKNNVLYWMDGTFSKQFDQLSTLYVGSVKTKHEIMIKDLAGNIHSSVETHQSNRISDHLYLLDQGTKHIKYDAETSTSTIINNVKIYPNGHSPINHLVGWRVKFLSVDRIITETDARNGYIDLGRFDFKTDYDKNLKVEISDGLGNVVNSYDISKSINRWMKNRATTADDINHDNFLETSEVAGNSTILRVKTDPILEAGHKIKIKNIIDDSLSVEHTLTSADLARGYFDINVTLKEGFNKLDIHYYFYELGGSSSYAPIGSKGYYLHSKITGNEISYNADEIKTIDHSSYTSGPLTIHTYGRLKEGTTIIGTPSTKDIFAPKYADAIHLGVESMKVTLRGIEMLDMGTFEPGYRSGHNRNLAFTADAKQLKEIWKNLSPGANTFYIQGDEQDKVNLSGMRKTTEKLADPNGRGNDIYDVYTDIATGTIRVAVDEDIQTSLYTSPF